MLARDGTDEEFDAVLGVVLRTGVILAGLVVFVGAIVFLARHGGETPRYHVFAGEPGELRSIHGIIGDVRQGSGRGVIQLGLLFLIATPIARVVFSVIGFLRQRDWLYVSVTLVVLTLLIYSLLTG